MRSRALHEAWMAILSCPVIRLEGDLSADDQLARIMATLDAGLLTSRFGGPASPAAERER